MTLFCNLFMERPSYMQRNLQQTPSTMNSKHTASHQWRHHVSNWAHSQTPLGTNFTLGFQQRQNQSRPHHQTWLQNKTEHSHTTVWLSTNVWMVQRNNAGSASNMANMSI